MRSQTEDLQVVVQCRSELPPDSIHLHQRISPLDRVGFLLPGAHSVAGQVATFLVDLSVIMTCKPKANQIRSRNRLRDQKGPAESDWIFQVTPRICSCFLAKTCKLAASRWNCCPKVCILEALPALDIFAWSISSCCKAAPQMSLGEVNNVCWDNRRQPFFIGDYV